jgi:plastocyanin
MIRVNRFVVFGGMALALLLLAGCGDDDDSAGDGGDDVSNELAATATEFAFDPDDWSVNAGEEFTIEFTNDGSVNHEWAVIKQGDDLESEADFTEEKVLFEVEQIEAGDSVSQSFTVDEAGTYQVVCALEDHFDAGMEGSLTAQ